MLSISSIFNVKFHLFSSILKCFKIKVELLIFKSYDHVYVTIIFQSFILKWG
jgi:hypothetical protein